MPSHRQVTECRHGGPISKLCTCFHCTLSVCAVCGAYEGSLTTHCPGERMSFDKQKEVYETHLDYDDDHGWHQGEPMKQRLPRFEQHTPLITGLAPLLTIIGCTCGWKVPQGTTDPDDALSQHVALAKIAPATDWAAIDRTAALKDAALQKLIAIVLARRSEGDYDAVLTRVEDEVDAYMGRDPDAHHQELLQKLEQAKAAWKLADRRRSKCEAEFWQAAEKLVAELEKGKRAP